MDTLIRRLHFFSIYRWEANKIDTISENLKEYQEGQVLLVNKPYGRSSFWVVHTIRKEICKHFAIKKLKVGHAGTLDPLATGLLIVCTGKSTKNIDNFQNQTKEYFAVLKLGSSTKSFDLETSEEQPKTTYLFSLSKIINILPQFVGQQQQKPPIFSAVKQDGLRAYKYARENKNLVLNDKTIFIYELELLDANPYQLILRINCSKGTYIRALARDIGLALDTEAYLTDLKRTKIGLIKLPNYLSLQQSLELSHKNI